MTNKGRWMLLLAGLALFLMAAGCSSKHKLVAGAPDWINRGGGAYEDEGDKVFYGVGAVTAITSPSLAMQTADQRARADIARQLETYVASLYRDYQTSTGAAAGRQPLEEQHVEESLKAVTQVSVRGARIIDHWRHPESDTIYALARLDLEGFKATLEEMPELEPALRSHIRDRAEKTFEEIRREEQGR